MKRIISIIISFILLTGCSSSDSYLQRAISLRDRLSKCKEISFTAIITADYTDKVYTFSLGCKADNRGELSFEVLSPDSIKGIAGNISSAGGKFTFDDTVLAFPLLAEGEVSPVSAPWLLLKALMGGYISSCGMDNGSLRITVDDSYEEDALQLDVWLNDQDLPLYAEVIWQGRKILSMEYENFRIL